MKAASRLLAASAALVLIITSISAYLRLSQYGLGCADWPACYGANPVGEASLSESDPLFWMRAVHRISATAAGLLFLAIALVWWNGRGSARERVLSVAPLSLALFLAWLGRYTPSSLPAVTIGNLLGGMATIAVLWWLRSAALAHRSTHRVGAPAIAGTAGIGLALIFAQMALGALVSARFAAAACPAFPTCGAWDGTFELSGLNPFADIARQELGEHTRQVLHMMHRYAGAAIALYLAWVGARAVRLGGSRRILGLVLLGLVAAQIVLSAALVLLQVPLGMAVAHNVIAALLILNLVSFLAGGKPSRVASSTGSARKDAALPEGREHASH